MYDLSLLPPIRTSGSTHSFKLDSAFQKMAADLMNHRPAHCRKRRKRESIQSLKLESTAWVNQLSRVSYDAVLGRTEFKDLRKGDTLIRANDEAAYWIGVMRGFLVLKHRGDASHALDGGVAAGCWLGESTVLCNSRWNCDLVTGSATTVALVPASLFRELLLTEPSFSKFILHLQANRVLRLHQQCELPSRIGTNARVARALAQVFLPLELHGGKYQIPLNQSELSDFLGLSRQRTNSALQALRALGEVELEYGSVSIRDPEALLQRSLTLHQKRPRGRAGKDTSTAKPMISRAKAFPPKAT
jgi:CRP/FNR family transcriptional regulator, cyclic AMP receptor protein